MDEIAEIVQTIESLQSELDELLVRGLRSAEPATLARLRARAEEFQRIGAEHLAERLSHLAESVESDDAGSAQALLQAQTSLRMFERVLSLEVAEATLSQLIAADEEAET